MRSNPFWRNILRLFAAGQAVKGTRRGFCQGHGQDAMHATRGDGSEGSRRRQSPEVRSPWWLRYGWAVTVSGLLVGQLLLDCSAPLPEPVRLLLEGAGLDRVSCPGDDSGRQQQQAEPAPR